MTKITIVTITYNAADVLERTLESTIAQTHRDVEHIIVDGASTDQTLTLAFGYKQRSDQQNNGHTVSIVSEPDHGIYDAMNKGFRMATGDVVGLINSDDMFCCDNAIEMVMRKFEENSDADAVYADLMYVGSNNTDKVIRNWITGEQRPMAKGWLPAHPTFYVRKHIYEQYGYFNLRYKLAADFELMLRFIEKYHIRLVYLPENLVRMRYGGATSSSLKNIIRQDKECFSAFKDNQIPVSCLYPVLRLLSKIKQFNL